ncbi:ATP-binding protein [Streptomyces corynorhini]|uniref:ATP-binding protein n=1 Tax=Streptomyces corynorhini TaxID=2282652 RepID=UPI0026C94D64|nr:tetratricopeptide repeat protein [Streptomyces corynorhini]
MNRTAELGQLNAVLPTEDGDPVVVSVCVVAGTAGAGKTSLVLHWAHQIRDRFPDGQLYVNLRGYDPGQPLSAQEALHGFLAALGVPGDSVPRDPDTAAAYYRSLLSDRRMLVVLDNAATAAQVRPLLPGGPHCLTVVTSRSRLSGLAIRDGARRLTLGTLPEPEAVALLRAVTTGYRTEDDLDELTELAGLCAALPLALRIAGERAASSPHLRLADLIAELRDESVLWDALSVGDTEEAEAVRTVFAWSYRALPEHGATLFRQLGLHPGPEFGLGAAAALAGLPVVRTRQLLDSLVGAHLLEQTGPDRYQFHDLLRAYAAGLAQQEVSPDGGRAALHRVLTWYLRTAEAARSRLAPGAEETVLPDPPSDLPEATRPPDFADYDAAMDWAEREHTNLLRTVDAAATAGHDALAWRLAVVLWDVQPPSASMGQWLAAGATGLAAARRTDDLTGQARLLTCLGLAHQRVSSWAESLECHQQALTIRRAADDRAGEADSLNLIGIIHLRRRQLDCAAARFEEAAALWRAVGSDRWAASALSNLATTHYSAGRLEQATACAEEALAAHRALGNAVSVGNVLHTLSRLRREQGDPEEALHSAEQALDIALSQRDQILEAYWLLSLGEAQRALDRPTDALVSYQRSADLHRRLGNRSREAMSWHGAGETYQALGRPDEAAHFHLRAATVHRDLADGWHEALALEALAISLDGTDPTTAGQHRSRALRLLVAYDDPRAVATRGRLAGAAPEG